MPTPTPIRAKGDALAQKPSDALADIFAGTLDGRFGQSHTSHLVQELTGFVEAIADAAGQGRQLFGGRRQAACVDAGFLVEGEKALAAASAVIVGALAGDIAAQADEAMAALAMIRGGVVAMRAGYAGSLVAVFFCSRCWR